MRFYRCYLIILMIITEVTLGRGSVLRIVTLYGCAAVQDPVLNNFYTLQRTDMSFWGGLPTFLILVNVTKQVLC
jgi:hypothetical protein